MISWLWWRIRLAIGSALKRAGGRLLDWGWALTKQAANDYSDSFQRYERRQ